MSIIIISISILFNNINKILKAANLPITLVNH